MTQWNRLKETFFTVVDLAPVDRADRLAQLATTEPALAEELASLLAADARGDVLAPLFDADAETPGPAQPSRIGPYEVLDVVASGAMGQVYRGRDTRLQRDVAIKVLPVELSDDPDRRLRLEREARLLASLNHSHVAQVYGLEDAAGSLAIVMELVKGPTLAKLIAAREVSPIPVVRVLTMARQIADGLDAAHEKGVIHRDLKPANIAVTEDGDVKILDFGVAKSLDGRASAGGPVATDAGVVLGTPAYMSPEQARGLAVDRRTDIWAFGCVLYELLVGRPPFPGVTATDCLAAVLAHEPDMAALPAATPTTVRTLLRHCLQKDPKRRLRDIADARLALDDAAADAGGRASTAADCGGAQSRGVRWGLLAAAAVLTLAVVTLLVGLASLDGARPGTHGRVVTSIVLPEGMTLAGTDPDARAAEARFALSPDGRALAIVASAGTGQPQIWIRDLRSPALRPLPDTEGASFPFWTPDAQSIGFVAQGQLKAIRLADATVRTVSSTAFRSGTWGRDGVILFTPSNASPIHAIPAGGGPSRPVTRLDAASGEVQHGEPAFLPDGVHFLYISTGSTTGGVLDPRGLYLGSLADPDRAAVLLPDATQARYAEGHLVFVQAGTLMAQPFDVSTLALGEVPFPIVEDASLSTVGVTGATAAFSVSDSAVLAYQAAVRTSSRLVIVDRQGTELGGIAGPGDYGDVAVSPDGTRVAVSVRTPTRTSRDLWVYDVAGSRQQRATFGADDEFAPVWSPDGRRVLYSGMRDGLVDLYVQDVGSTDPVGPLQVDGLGLGRFAADWSRDGRSILYIGGGRAIARSDLWMASMADARAAAALLDSAFVETHGRFSPDGRWVVYTSNESGRFEVYADRLPARGARQLISTGGGGWPRWSADGREVFYLSPDDHLMVAPVRVTGDRLVVGTPQTLFRLTPRPPARLDAYAYDQFPDGRRFVVNAAVADTAATMLTLVLDWTSGR